MATGEDCEVCGEEIVNSYSRREHHTSYQPEETIVVCSSCHRKIHETDGFRDDLKPDIPWEDAKRLGLINGERSDVDTSKKNMEVTTIRLDEGLIENLEEESSAFGFNNRTEYIRWILRNRGVIHQNTEDTEGDAEVDPFLNRVDELEQRVAMLEQGKIEEIRAETGVETADDTPTDSEAAHSGAVPVAGEDDPNPSPDASSVRGSPPEADDAVRERLRDELPGSGDLLAARVDAILAMRDELRERGEATRDDLLNAVDVDATGYADANSLWKNSVAGRDTLRALDGVDRPPTGRAEWRWSG
jgi:hypothetical protein